MSLRTDFPVISSPYAEMLRRGAVSSGIGQGIPRSAVRPNPVATPNRQTGEGSLFDPEKLKETIQNLQGLGLINGNVSAEFLAQLVMMLANRFQQFAAANQAARQANFGGPGMNLGGGPQMRGGLPRQQFSQSRARPGRSWRPSNEATTGAPVQAITNPLTGNDKKTAEFINKHLAAKGSPAAKASSPTAGEMMVQAGKQHNVDPMVLLSISQHETNHGKLGVGMRKMLGVSAYDANPNNINPKFDGLQNQIFQGAKTFAKLRAKGGASASDSIGRQLQAANRAGWATDGKWHAGVGRHYNDIAKKAHAFNGSTPALSPGTTSVAASPDAINKIPNYHELSPSMQKAALEAVGMGLTVTSTTGGKHAKTSNHYRHNNADGKGHAIDVSGAPSKMAAFFRRYAGQNPRELYYDPLGGIKRGRNIGPIGGHGNHVHLALS